MARVIGIALVLLTMLSAVSGGCKGGSGKTGSSGDTGGLGRYMFDTPTPFTDVGIVDTPRLSADPALKTVQLAYILNDGNSQKIMYTRTENGEFRPPSYLSQREGQKSGGCYIASLPGSLIFYWINVSATGGQLMYKTSGDGGKVFGMEARWNQRNEARWPCVLGTRGGTVAYFFLEYRDGWELASNRNFSPELEQTIDVAQGTPLHLQGVTDGRDLVCLAYFERQENSDGGRIAFLKSIDGGRTFSRSYLFEDRVIRSLMSFFAMERATYGRERAIHLIFAEETPDLTTLYYSRSLDDGVHFSVPVAVLESAEPLTRSPLLMSQDKYVFVATADTETDGPAMRYVFSEDGGESFDTPAVITRNLSSPETLSGVMGGDGSVMLVWDDLSAHSEGGEQLYCVKGTLRGR